MSSAQGAAAPKCWVCGDPATSGEHGIKKSDLAAVFAKPSQQNPLFHHSHTHTNVRIGNFNSDVLKLPSGLCAKCNNETTQPYDTAWAKFSEHARTRTPRRLA